MKRVLIVDDSSFIRVQLKSILAKGGFEVAGEAADGQIAVNKYKELQPDIVTMDITMPEKDGIEALKEILAIDPNAKVIMISAMGQEMYVLKAVTSGAKGFIVKPFKSDYVIETLNKLS